MSSNNNNSNNSNETTTSLTVKTAPKPRLSPQKRAGIHFPVSRITRSLKDGDYASRYSVKASVYLSAVLEYLACEILDVSGISAIDEKKEIVKPRHLLTGIQDDAALNELMADAPGGTHIAGAGWIKSLPRPNSGESNTNNNNF